MTLKISGAELEAFGKVVGLGAHAEGTGTQASGNNSHSEGANTTASSSNAHAEGGSAQASGSAAHAEGLSSLASGTGAHAEGGSTQATTSYAHAEGYQTQATGLYSHAENQASVASGTYSSAGGYTGKADMLGAWARGSGVITQAVATRAQVSTYTLGLVTSTTTAGQILTADGSTSLNTTGNSGTNVLLVPLFANYLFELALTVRRASQTNQSAGWVYKGLIAHDTGQSCRMVGTPTVVASWADTTMGTVAFVAANSPTNYLQISVTPALAATLHWFGTLTVTELIMTS